eukprot:scaffold19630_cov23-Tisochrysis_lutea.AAC.1
MLVCSEVLSKLFPDTGVPSQSTQSSTDYHVQPFENPFVIIRLQRSETDQLPSAKTEQLIWPERGKNL